MAERGECSLGGTAHLAYGEKCSPSSQRPHCASRGVGGEAWVWAGVQQDQWAHSALPRRPAGRAPSCQRWYRRGPEYVLPSPLPLTLSRASVKVQQITEIWFIARPAKMIKNALCHLSKFKPQRLPGENCQNPSGLQGPTHASVRAGSAQVLGRDTAMLPYSPQPRAVDLMDGRLWAQGPLLLPGARPSPAPLEAQGQDRVTVLTSRFLRFLFE